MRRLCNLLATILMCVVGASASAQIVVTFTGRDSTNQYHIPLHHVDVFNLDQLWEEVLYYPDTTLILGTVGVDDYELLTGFELKQNVPNPFDGTTEFALVLPEGRDVLLEIYDITGKLAVGKHFSALPAGTHLFQATLTSPQTYLLSAKVDNGQMTIKMINEGHGAGNTIRHLGMTDANGDFTLYLKDDKAASGYPFSLGDEMKYTGYAVIDDVVHQSKTILRDQNASETIPLKFNVSAPEVNTIVSSTVTATTATCGVQVVNDGGSAITALGICWSTSSNPTINNDTISGLTGTITGLNPNTTYHVRAYATNSVGTAYGEDETFTTLCDIVNVSITGDTSVNYGQPAILIASGANSYHWNTGDTDASITVYPSINTIYTVTGTNSYGCTATASITVKVNFLAPYVITETVDNITATTAVCGGNVISTGGAVVTERGVCWSTSPNPTVNGFHLPIGNGLGSFNDIVSGLTPNTTYHICAYAINSVDTSYGADSIFTTLCDTVNVSISGITTINYGDSTTLTASGANSYVWNNGSTTVAITVSPTATTTYTVTGTNIYNCSATASITVTVNPIAPVVATNGISSITSTSAKCGGNVMDNGGAPVIERGICWSTSPNPTVSGSHLPVGNGTGSFTSIITGLTPNTTYHVRAYATNSVNTSYGGDSTFTTLCDTVNISITGNTTINYGQSAILIASGANSYSWNNGSSTAAITISPTVTTSYTVTGMNIHGCTATASVTVTVNPIAPTVITNGITNITSTTASCGGTVTDNGGTTVFVRGICWSTSPNPTVSDNSSNNNDGGMGYFSRNISGLNPNTTYHVRAYAINSVDTAYGADSVFTTLCNAVNISIAGNTSIDYGQSTTLTASGTNSYQWSTGANTGSITVSPTAITTYTVTGTNSYGCTATVSVTVTVNYLEPTVTTQAVNNITASSANCGGTVTFDGGKTVTSRGVCWGLNPNPSLSGSHLPIGNGVGGFSDIVSNLTPNTTYYVRAYAINIVDTAYGSDVTFKTLCNTVNLDIAGNTIVSYGESTTLTASGANSYHWSTNANNESISVCPTTTTTYTVTGTNLYGCTATASVTVTVNFLAPVVVTNNDVNSITSTSAICGGTVTSDGGASVTARGVCWSTSPNPTVSACCTTNDGGGMGSFTSYITELTPGTTYYVRAYATNSEGTSYGEPRTFTTLTTPIVTTAAVFDITGHTATCGGTVTSDGGTSVTTRGVCWSTSENPTLDNGHTNDGNGTGIFTSNITGLTEGTTYHVRAYATNSVGTSYGADVTFTTPLLPTVITDSISSITDSTAICGGVVISDGGAPVTARGVCWSSFPNPTVNDAHTIDGDGTGIFNSSLMGLTAGTTYYVRAYATSVAGTAYGQQVVFTTTIPDGAPCIGTPTVTDIDGNIYNTVKIGEQCWMRENLKTTRYANGVNISKGSSTSTTTAYRYYPYNDSANVSIYGFLYNWYATVHGYVGSSENPSGIQGVCPTGWHVPSNAEWAQLANYMSGLSQYWCGDTSANKAKALASSTGWNSSTNTCAIGNNQSTNNATNFSALPAGTYYDFYDNPGQTALFWSATESSINSAKTCYLFYNSAKVIRGDAYMSNGYSVRCLRDSVPGGAPSNISCQTAKIIPVVYNGTTEPYCPTYGNLTLTVVDSVTGNSIPNLTYTWAGESVNVFSTDSTSFVMIIPEWCDTVYNAFVTVNDSQGCVKTVSRTINVASTGPRFIGTLADTTVPRQSECRCFIPDFRDFITNSIVTDDCFTLSNIKSTSFWYDQNPQAGTELTEESQVVTITITNPCGKSNTITVNVHKSADIPAMALTSTPDHFCNPTFEKPGDGTITIIAPTSGSGHTYTYKVFDANDNELSLLYDFPTNLTCYWLSHQTYRVQAYEAASGCSVSDTITVGHNPYSVDFNFIITPNTDCSSATGNGSITVTNPISTNPNPDFTYSIDNVHYSTNPVFTDLADGTYSVYVKDVTSACIVEKLVTIGLVDTIPPTISIDIPIRLYPVLGYDYSWNSPDSMTFVNAIVPYISDNCTDLSSLINSLEFLWENTTESPIGATDIFHNANHRTITVKVTDGSGNSTETVVFFMDFPDAVPCPGTPTVTDIDGNTYNTVRIGGQCWMKENLRTTKYADGTSIPAGSSTSYTSPYYYDYSASSIPLAERGYLYNWPAVMHGASSSSANPSGVQGICPNGWHVPSDAEWMQLTNYVSSQSNYVCGDTSINNAKALAATTEWRTDITACAIGNNLAANNATNFSALPAAQPVFHYTAAEYWSATEENSDSTFVNYLMLSFNSERAHLFATEKSVYQSVRCLRDETAVIDEKSCPNAPTVTDIDSNTYNTVQIGGQCWMKENLRTTHYADGTSIPHGSSTSNTVPYYYDYTTSDIPLEDRGYLYNWSAVMNGSPSSDKTPSGVQGICPTGWHIPSSAEWDQLIYFISGQSQYWCGEDSTSIAKALASTTGWPNATAYTCAVGNDQRSNDASGFRAIPAGYRYNNFLSGTAGFWSSTGPTINGAYIFSLNYYRATAGCSGYDKFGGFSVRCLCDENSTLIFPTVTTDTLNNITSVSVSCGGNVISEGTSKVIARGVCWSGFRNPTIADNHTVDGNGFGSFTSNITGLLSNKVYYLRAYATNQYGTVYGNEVSFTTPINPDGDVFSCLETPTVTDIDGNTYNTVQIGAQCWLRENLRTSRYTDSTLIPLLSTSTTSIDAYRSYPRNDSSYVTVYGYLYSWKAVINDTTSCDATPSGVQGICPIGWHVPSDAEWAQLSDYVSSQSQYWCDNDSSKIAKALAANSDWTTYSSSCAVGNNQCSNNKTGFAAMPAGEHNYNGYFSGSANFWSTTESSDAFAWCRKISYSNSVMIRNNSHKRDRYSVRCLRNEGASSLLPSITTNEVTSITATTAVCGGSISNGDIEIVERGVCWSSIHNPTKADNHTIDGSGNGSFTSNITELMSNMVFFVRAYAVTQFGTIYGNEVSFTTPISPNGDALSCPNTPTVTDVDGNIYNTVHIGAQCWTRENLKTTHYADSAIIPSWYYPAGDSSYKQSYGLLYKWSNLMNNASSSDATPSGVRGVCPLGWHLPSDAEWSQLTDYVSNQIQYVCGGNNNNIAKSLASTLSWISSNDSCNVGYNQANNNAVGFGAFPAGFSQGNFYPYDFGLYTIFWSATEDNYNYAWTRKIYNSVVERNRHNKNNWCSVRCILDEDLSQNFPTVTTDVISNVSTSSATCGGNVSYTGEEEIVARGVCWGTTHNPTVDGAHSIDGTGIGNFSSTITGLASNTTFYIRAYATTIYGTSYGNEVCITIPINPNGDEKSCPEAPIIIDIDGNMYNTVQIGNQCWMRENLKTMHYADGTIIALGSTTSNTIDYRYYPNNDSSNVSNYGYCYNGVVLKRDALFDDNTTTTQKICPVGWHVPSTTEWNELTNFLNRNDQYICGSINNHIAKALSAQTGWNCSGINCTPGNDQLDNNFSGFSARPANEIGGVAHFWLKPEPYLSYRSIAYNSADVGNGQCDAFYSGSVRCLRDETTTVIIDEKSCPTTPTVTDHEGNVYATVQIGDQCWMRDNLRTTTSPSTRTYLIPFASTGYSYTGKQARWYNNDSATYAPMNYGLLYNWNAAVDTFNTAYGETSVNTSSSNVVSVSFTGHRRGICPAGWHLPSDAEWTQLTDYLKSQSEYVCGDTNINIAKSLADSLGWHNSTNTCAVGNTPSTNNTTGFSVVPAGICYGSSFEYAGFSATLWSFSQNEIYSTHAYRRGLYRDDAYVVGGSNNKYAGFSVRCLRDESSAVIDEKSCPNAPTVSDIDGNVYRTVQIGDQCWMRENLRTTKYADGTSIPLGTANSYDNPYYYDCSTSNIPIEKRGYLYNWRAVVHDTSFGNATFSVVQGICPDGWHVSSDAEWTQLINYVSSNSQYVCGNNNSYIAKALAAPCSWNNDTTICSVGNNLGTNNATGFGAMPADCFYNGYNNTGDYAYFWSVTEGSEWIAWARFFSFDSANVNRYQYAKNCGFSVRCLLSDGETPAAPLGDAQPCPGTPTVTDIDGNMYNTVQIGQQCWTKENLRTTKYADGTDIFQGSDTSTILAYWYYPNNNVFNKQTYGLLYNWPAVMHCPPSSNTNQIGVQGICPTGWHVPSEAEWTQLLDYLSCYDQYICSHRASNIAKSLASTTGWSSTTNNCTIGNDQLSNNASGFSALPAGYYNNSISLFGIDASFWSATESSDTNALGRLLHANASYVTPVGYYKYNGLSVRCLRDSASDADTTETSTSCQNIKIIKDIRNSATDPYCPTYGVMILEVVDSITGEKIPNLTYTWSGESVNVNESIEDTSFIYIIPTLCNHIYSAQVHVIDTITGCVADASLDVWVADTAGLVYIGDIINDTVEIHDSCKMYVPDFIHYLNNSNIIDNCYPFSAFKDSFRQEPIAGSSMTEDTPVTIYVTTPCDETEHAITGKFFARVPENYPHDIEYLVNDEPFTHVPRIVYNCVNQDLKIGINPDGWEHAWWTNAYATVMPANDPEYNFTINANTTEIGNIYSYCVNVIDTNGCPASGVINLVSKPVQVVTIYTTICESNLPFEWKGKNLTETGTYYDTLISVNGCDSVVTMHLTVNEDPQFQLTATENVICVGGTTVITVESIGWNNADVNYEWTSTEMGTSFSFLGSEYTFTAETEGVFTFNVTALETTSGCMATDDITITVNADPATPIVTVDNAVVCDGSQVTLTVTNTNANATYIWEKNGVVIPGANGAVIYDSPMSIDGNLTNYIYTVIAELPMSGCTSTASSNTVVTAIPIPSAIVSVEGNTTVCAGGSTMLHANITPVSTNYTYQWYKDNVLIVGATEADYIASEFASETAYNFQVVATVNPGCHVSAYAPPITFVANPYVEATISNNITCLGGTATLTAIVNGGFDDVDGYTFEWYRDNTQLVGNVPEYVTSANDNVGNYTYWITVISNYGCQSTSNIINHNVVADPIVTISVASGYPTTVCNGGASMLKANVTGGYGNITYQWYKNGDILAGETNQHLALNNLFYGASDTYTVEVTQTGAGCSNSASVALDTLVTVAPNYTVNVSGYGNVCEGGTLTLNATVNGVINGDVLSYNWYRVFNGTSTLINDANAAQYQTSDFMLGDYNEYYVVAVSSISGCSTVSNSVPCNVVSNPTIVIQGPHTICEGGNLTLNAFVSGGVEGVGYTYTWDWTGAATGTATTTVPTYSVNLTAIDAAATYYFTVTISRSDNTGCTATSNAYEVNVIPVPTVFVTTDNAYVCQNGNVTLTAHVSPNGAYNYVWTIDGEQQVVNAATVTTYMVTTSAINATVAVSAASTSATCSATSSITVPIVTTVTDIDGNTYNTIQIGGQCWMKENLRTTKFADGTFIEEGSSTSSTIPYRFIPDDNASNVPTYGYLYNWAAVMHGASSNDETPSGIQGICPDGWHLPSDAEWSQLTDYVSSQSQYWCDNNSNNIAKALSSTTGWFTTTTNCDVGNDQSSNNATGFNALPAGYATYGSGDFNSKAYLWSTTLSPIMGLGYFSINFYSSAPDCDFACDFCSYSVRCLHDDCFLQYFPTVSTSDVVNVTSSTATCGGNVISTENVTVNTRGVCWSILHNPTIKDDHTIDGSGAGSFTSSITGLKSNFTYYIRAYATNSFGTVYGNEVSVIIPVNSNGDAFSCPGTPTVSDDDGNVYNTVQIGGQCWMRENLRTTKYPDGTTIPQGDITTMSTTGGWYYPNEDSSYRYNYGLLYNWSAVMNGSSSIDSIPSGVQGICPAGWHVPSNLEWIQLTNYLHSQSQYWCNNDSDNIAKSLAAPGRWLTNKWLLDTCYVCNNPHNNNSTGFGALPAGTTNIYGKGFCSDAYFWSATEDAGNNIHVFRIVGTFASEWLSSTSKYYGSSVRCLRDENTTDGQPCPGTPTVTDIDGNVYNTVKVGEQCWMKENLRTTRYADGTEIYQGVNSSSSIGYWYYPNNDATNKFTYGLLYNWSAVMNGASPSYAIPSGVQGICPIGWHVPSNAEWTNLTDYVRSQSQYRCDNTNSYIAKALSSKLGWVICTTYNCAVGNNPSSNNITGFSVLPAGFYSETFNGIGYSTYFWSSTEASEEKVKGRCIFNVDALVYSGSIADINKSHGFSVRCLRD